MIKAPYNFVPLHKNVVIPHWADFISHDIPFFDFQSGEFVLKIKAESPIFVMDGMKEKDSNEAGRFAALNGRYFIPGSSVKGMIRSVLEIMTFSKMKNKVKDDRYAVRDFGNKHIYNPSQIAGQVRSGWLRWREDGEYELQECQYNRIETRNIRPRVRYTLAANESCKEKEKSASIKYENFEADNGRLSGQFKRDQDNNDPHRENAYLQCNEGENGEPGTIVFTGQPSRRKKYDFIFMNSQKEAFLLDKKVIDNFFFAYYDHDDTRSSCDWKYWKEKLNNHERIPVFFRYDDPRKKTVKDIGLSMLYKIVYKKSIHEAVKNTQKDVEGIDFSEAIFGHVDEITNRALKGRVYFGHALAGKDSQEDSEVHAHVLSSPKASYYPTYIKQGSQFPSRYNTLMDGDAEIAGWKRYPIHKNNSPTSNTLSAGQENVAVRFKPLVKDTEFSCTVRYHNLRKIELGALISAVTFHNSQGGTCFHSLGLAKPLGYGKVSVTIEGMSEEDQKEYMKGFEAYMDVSLPPDKRWHMTDQIKELFAMVTEPAEDNGDILRYMDIGMGNGGRNEFNEAKKNLMALSNYTNLVNQSVKVANLIEEEDIIRVKHWKETEEAILKKKAAQLDVLDQFLDEEKAKLYRLLEDKKAAYIGQLKEKREALLKKKREIEREEKLRLQKLEEEEEAKKREEKKEKEAQKAKKEGFDFTRKVKKFDDLKKPFQIHLGKLLKDKYERLENIYPDGMIPKEYEEPLKQALVQLFEKSKKNIRKKWLAPLENNATFKKVSEWIGKEKAQQWLDEFRNLD